jgi:hypothetical protein
VVLSRTTGTFLATWGTRGRARGKIPDSGRLFSLGSVGPARLPVQVSWEAGLVVPSSTHLKTIKKVMLD